MDAYRSHSQNGHLFHMHPENDYVMGYLQPPQVLTRAHPDSHPTVSKHRNCVHNLPAVRVRRVCVT